ncbi:MAG: sulfate adenylyltransferase subunit CysD [Thermonemataceae bacterium]|nr:sulfate adenylyltransferase subunit CysD [Thermonemataceae bacterium]
MYQIDYLKQLEAEAIYILRETAGQFQKPALLFSGGKDSITLVHLAYKAFKPGKIPFPLVHIDTGHNFSETIDFRDSLVGKMGVQLIVGSVEESISKGTAKDIVGKGASRNTLQSITLLETIEKYGFDACIGGARRDEEKARAKERIFSLRDEFGQWNPKQQRPELWNILNGAIQANENMRVFPLSNWTELDVWNYILQEKIDVPSIYFTHKRICIRRNGQILPYADFIFTDENDELLEMNVRFRTVGDITCTAAISSEADTVEKIIKEIQDTRLSERGARMDDKISDTAMEDRKKNGYF